MRQSRVASSPSPVVVALLGLNALGCAGGGSEAELLALLDRDRRAHLETDAALLAESLADTVWNVEAGEIGAAARADLEAAFTAYFEGAAYRAWDDVEPPLVRISDDGSMAWVARRVTVDREAPAFGGGTRADRFESAWTATYEYVDGAWRMTSVTSTFAERPSAARIQAGGRRAMGIEDAPPGLVRFEAEASGPGGGFGVAFAAAADRSARIDFDPGMSAAIGPEEGWVRLGPDLPAIALSDTLETFVRGHDLLMNVIDPESRYGPMRYAGVEPFAGQPAHRIDGRDALGAPIEIYYAVADTVPLGFRVVDHLRGLGPVETTLSGWTEQAGARWPAFARFVQGTEAFEYTIVAVETSPDADPGPFRPSAEGPR